jgi:hypothetical protein
MTTQQTPPNDTWGAPPPQRPRKPWSTRRIVASAVLAVAIVGGGTAAVLTATSSSATTGGAGGGQSGPGGGPGFGGGFGRPGAAGAGLADALHGDFVVASGGRYATERLQTGTVTAVSATDITVRSTDGYVQTYVVGSATSVDQGADSISEVAKGNTVTIVAKVSGQTATASTIEDTSIDSRAGRGGTGQGGGPGGPPGN